MMSRSVSTRSCDVPRLKFPYGNAHAIRERRSEFSRCGEKHDVVFHKIAPVEEPENKGTASALTSHQARSSTGSHEGGGASQEPGNILYVASPPQGV